MKAASRTKLAQVFVALADRYPLGLISQALASLLRQQHRLREVDYLLADIARQLLRQKKHLIVHLSTAQPISAGTQKEIVTVLKKRSGATKVETVIHQDPSLTGGLIARTPTFEIEWSVKQQLNRLKAN